MIRFIYDYLSTHMIYYGISLVSISALTTQVCSQSLPIKSDQINVLTMIPTLKKVEVDQWLAYHEGIRYFGIYEDQKHLGWARDTVSYDKSQECIGVKKELHLFATQSRSAIKSIKQSKQSKQKAQPNQVIIIHKKYQSNPPYALIEYSINTTTPKEDRIIKRWSTPLMEKRLQNPIDDSLSNLQMLHSKETLRSLIGLPTHVTVGTQWTIPVFTEGQDQHLIYKMIDRRFEYRGGLWSQMLEFEVFNTVLNDHTTQGTRYVIDSLTRVWSISTHDRSFITQEFKKAQQGIYLVKARTLKEIQNQRGQLLETQLHQVMKLKYEKFNQCYQVFLHKNPMQSVRITLRLDIGEDGLLRSVAAVENQHRHLQDCVYKHLEGTRFHKPQKGAAMLAYPLSFTP